jgi:hypothetical protein
MFILESLFALVPNVRPAQAGGDERKAVWWDCASRFSTGTAAVLYKIPRSGEARVCAWQHSPWSRRCRGVVGCQGLGLLRVRSMLLLQSSSSVFAVVGSRRCTCCCCFMVRFGRA